MVAGTRSHDGLRSPIGTPASGSTPARRSRRKAARSSVPPTVGEARVGPRTTGAAPGAGPAGAAGPTPAGGAGNPPAPRLRSGGRRRALTFRPGRGRPGGDGPGDHRVGHHVQGQVETLGPQ